EEFLTSCNSSWSSRDRTSALRKLGRIGVSNVAELLRLEQDGLLNNMLAAAGERRFSPETLASIRMAGTAEEDSEQDILEEFAQLLSDCVCVDRTTSPAAASHERSGRHTADGLFRRQVNRGLAYIDQAAKEVHMRNEHLSRCLEEVQVDISRIADRMQAARRERERGRAATSAAASRMFAEPAMGKQSFYAPRAAEPPVRPAASRTYFSTYARASSPRTKTSSRKSGLEGESPRCARAAQEGFRFGGWQPPSRPLSETTSIRKPDQILQDSVRAQLASLKHESKADQKAAVKRLLVQWHPDRNPESQKTATEIFQFIQEEKDKMLGL
ncbi:unnamed protein product, partial [Symbiodinium pilosum]